MKKNVFVVGLDDYNLQKLKNIKNAENYNFIKLLDLKMVQEHETFPLSRWITKAEKQLNDFDGSIDAIIGFWDFPVSPMVPILSYWHNTNAPTITSLLKCEHKYWSRLKQSEVIPENIPDFRAVNPFDEDAAHDLELGFPFWLKPVKAFASQLGFYIEDSEALEEALEIIRNNISKFAVPFNHILSYIELPNEVAKIDGHACIAESIIGGKQCTLSGYSYNKKINIYGVIDSIRYPGKSSFFRYQYPSSLPEEVQDRMTAIAKTVIRHLEFDNSPFNIEFFYDEDKDKIWLLEVNTRISQSHSDMYEKVDGRSNHQVLVEIALGIPPEMPKNEGEYKYSAKFHYRVFEDGIIEKAPGREEFDKLAEEQPDTIVTHYEKEGRRLSEMQNQDSYSYRLAVIYLGADSEDELVKKYERCLEILDYKIKKIKEN